MPINASIDVDASAACYAAVPDPTPCSPIIVKEEQSEVEVDSDDDFDIDSVTSSPPPSPTIPSDVATTSSEPELDEEMANGLDEGLLATPCSGESLLVSLPSISTILDIDGDSGMPVIFE